jgi:hypothetical protein
MPVDEEIDLYGRYTSLETTNRTDQNRGPRDREGREQDRDQESIPQGPQTTAVHPRLILTNNRPR